VDHEPRLAALRAIWQLLWLAVYFRFGRGMPRKHAATMGTAPKQPFPIVAAKGTSHCGAGCTLGDIVAEWLAFALPAVAVALGWKSLFGDKTFAVWILDYALAFLVGIGFQYFTIQPMRHLSIVQGVAAALKADAASITAWQIGMYGFMAFAQFVCFAAFGGAAKVDTPEFWFAMQIAMLCGFVTSYPVNWMLLKRGVKEEM
jgi:branched-subunit amino acid transport protein